LISADATLDRYSVRPFRDGGSHLVGAGPQPHAWGSCIELCNRRPNRFSCPDWRAGSCPSDACR
jgi:hypothetical protein